MITFQVAGVCFYVMAMAFAFVTPLENPVQRMQLSAGAGAVAFLLAMFSAVTDVVWLTVPWLLGLALAYRVFDIAHRRHLREEG